MEMPMERPCAEIGCLISLNEPYCAANANACPLNAQIRQSQWKCATREGMSRVARLNAQSFIKSPNSSQVSPLKRSNCI